MARNFDNSKSDSIWNSTVSEAKAEIHVDPKDVHDVIALFEEKRRRKAIKNAAPRVGDIAEILNANPAEIAALLGDAHARRLARHQNNKRKAKMYASGFAILFVAAAILANIDFWPQKSSLSYVSATPESNPVKLLASQAPVATYVVVYDFYPSSAAEWLTGPKWDEDNEFLSSDELPHTISVGGYGYDSVTTITSRRLKDGVIEYRRQYQFALPTTGSKAIYMMEGINAGGCAESMSIPTAGWISQPSTVFEVVKKTEVKQ